MHRFLFGVDDISKNLFLPCSQNHLQTIGYHGDVPKYREYERICFDALALLKEQEETKTIICQKYGDEIEIKWSLLIKPDMEAIAKRDAFLSDKNGKKLNDAMQSLCGED